MRVCQSKSVSWWRLRFAWKLMLTGWVCACPSAYTRFIPKSLSVTVAASRDIEPGEEITISCESFPSGPPPQRSGRGVLCMNGY